jgi:hypothetical protein
MKYLIIRDGFKYIENRTQVPKLFDKYCEISEELSNENPEDLDIIENLSIRLSTNLKKLQDYNQNQKLS